MYIACKFKCYIPKSKLVFSECNDLYFIAIAFIAFTTHEIKQCHFGGFFGTPGRSNARQFIRQGCFEWVKIKYDYSYEMFISGSGKSYTMMGSSTQTGIIPRLCDDLFERISNVSQPSKSSERE